jgi:hypothetical protein
VASASKSSGRNPRGCLPRLGSDSSPIWLRVRNEMSKLPEQQSAKTVGTDSQMPPEATAAYEGVA